MKKSIEEKGYDYSWPIQEYEPIESEKHDILIVCKFAETTDTVKRTRTKVNGDAVWRSDAEAEGTVEERERDKHTIYRKKRTRELAVQRLHIHKCEKEKKNKLINWNTR